jgi:hypothetical protein
MKQILLVNIKIINRTLEPSLTIYNTLAFPTLLYGNETWAIKEPDKSRITSAELNFIRKAKYTQEDCEIN